MQNTKQPTKKKTEADRQKLLAYICAEYGIPYPDKDFRHTLEHINNGTKKYLQAPIRYETLLDMFEHYKPELEELRIQNKTSGREFETAHKILIYDLEVILSKYADYVAEMETRQARAAEYAAYIKKRTSPEGRAYSEALKRAQANLLANINKSNGGKTV